MGSRLTANTAGLMTRRIVRSDTPGVRTLCPMVLRQTIVGAVAVHLEGGAMKKFAAGLLMGLILTAGVVFTASKSDNDVLREVRDRTEIEDLMWRYARALDTNDAEAYASAYAPDGQFSAGGNPTKGRDALKKMIADLRQRQTDAQAKGEPKGPPMYHMSANERIQFTDKDHARIEAYYITAIAAGGAAVPLRVVGVGRSVDDVARLNGQWVIVSRNVSPQD